MQSAMVHSVESIQKIQSVIGELTVNSVAIVAAVDQQKSATVELSRSAQNAAHGTKDVSSNIVVVQSSVKNTGASADNVLTSASELSQQSNSLELQMEQLLNNMRQA